MFRNQVILSLVLTFGFAFILISCSKDEDSSSPTQTQNHPPVIRSVVANPVSIHYYVPDHTYMNDIATLTCLAEDMDKDQLTYIWSSRGGFFLHGADGPSVQWGSRSHGEFYISVTVTDGIEIAIDSVLVDVP